MPDREIKSTRPESPRTEVIERLAGEIARAARGLSGRLIVGHGSGSFGHVAARRHGLAQGIRSADQLPGVSITQERAAALHRIVTGALAAAGALPYSVAPSSCVVSAGGLPVTLADEPLRLALRAGLLPVAYGDVVTDRDWGVSICSTERFFDLLARRLQEQGETVHRVLWLGETDGVWDADGRTIPRISAETFQHAAQAIGSPAGTDVTGATRPPMTRVPFGQPPGLGEVLDQDSDLLPVVQKGLRSRGFKGPLWSDQEQRVRHFHRELDRYINGEK